MSYRIESPLLSEYEELAVGPTGSETVRVPRFTIESLSRVKEEVVRNRNKHLASRPIGDIVECLDNVNRKWLDRNYHLRKKAQKELPLITGYSSEMIELILDYLPNLFTRDNIYEMLKAEIGDSKYLDGFYPKEGHDGSVKAFGPELVVVVNAGNVPALPILSKNRNLLVKAAQISKVAREEPVFSFLYDESIAEEDPGLASTMADGYWKGGDNDIERIAFNVPLVVAYGGPQTIEDIAKKIDPTKTRFIPYGHKLSFGVVGKEYLTKDEIDRVSYATALSTSLYDQQGCLSPHVIWVEEGGEISPEQFGEYLAKYMESVLKDLPRGDVPLDISGRIGQIQQTYEFRALSEDGIRLWRPGGTEWTVIYEKNPEFTISCMYRVIRIKPIDDIDRIQELVEPIQEYLQTVGVELSEKRRLRFADQMGRLGACRVTPLDKMGAPNIGPHDGRYGLAELLEWTVIEE